MKVLVYQIGQLGDTLVSIPALRAVRHYFGQSSRIVMLHDVIHKLVTAEMVLAGSGLVDEFIPYPARETFGGTLRTMARLRRRLRQERFDAVISLLPSDRPRMSLIRDRLFFRCCGITKLIGFRPYPAAKIRPRDAAGRPMAIPREAVLRLRRLFGEETGLAGKEFFEQPLLTLDRPREAAVDSWLEHRRRHPLRPLVALCPGCKKPANLWPADRFVEIARRLLALDEFELVILGGPSERELADTIVSALDGEAIHAAGCFSVMESAALLSRCSLLIGLDTGTTHLAAAVGVPCVVIQSANSYPGQWNPLGEGHAVVRRNSDCEGCLRQTCPIAGHPCMRNLTVDQVWSAIGNVTLRTEHEHYASHSHV